MADRSRATSDENETSTSAVTELRGREPTASTTQMRVHLAEHHDALTGELVLRHVPGHRVVDLGVGSPAISEWVAERAARLSSVPLSEIQRYTPAVLAAGTAEEPRAGSSGTSASSSATSSSAASSSTGGAPTAETSAPNPNTQSGARSETRLPLRSESFDVGLILHTLPHLGFDATSSEAMARWLLGEAARVVRPGGVVLVDIANPRSLAGVVAGVRNPATIIRQVPGGSLLVGPRPVAQSPGSSQGSGLRAGREGGHALHPAHDRDRITRYDTIGRLHRLAPASLEDVEVHGIGVFAPRARVLSWPLVGGLVRRLDWFARDGLFLRYFGARLLIVLRKLPAARRRADR